MNLAIVVATYNRPGSFKRLLNSLSSAKYDDDRVDLILSVDKSHSNECAEIATDFKWNFGNKRVYIHPVNLGLRKHIIFCGDCVDAYDGVIVLEDDLFVSLDFYLFARSAVNFYMLDATISGIGLYSYGTNEFSKNKPFIPMNNGSDVFFLQVPSSWGQCWSKSQWLSFRKWYSEIDFNNDSYSGMIPSSVFAWPSSSWKKYYFLYNALFKKYFVYPYISKSTNMNEVGVHNISISNCQQVPLSFSINNFFRFVNFTSSESICYDVFFESQMLVEFISDSFDSECVIVDYYGLKAIPEASRYLLSVNSLPYKIVQKWGLRLKPYELNIIYNIDGDDIFLYDTHSSELAPNINSLINLEYLHPSLNLKDAIEYVKLNFIVKINKFLKRLTL